MWNVERLKSYHVDNHFPECLTLFLAEILEDVTVFFLQQFEPHGQMMVFQHRFIIIHQSKF